MDARQIGEDAEHYRTARHVQGWAGQDALISWLRQRGHRVDELAARSTIDLRVNGSTLVECKQRENWTADGRWPYSTLYLPVTKTRRATTMLWFAPDLRCCLWYPDTTQVSRESGAKLRPQMADAARPWQREDTWEIPVAACQRGWRSLDAFLRSVSTVGVAQLRLSLER